MHTLERRESIATAVRDDVIHLPQIKEYPEDLVLGKFMETKWDLSHDVPKKYGKKEALSIDNFEIRDSTEDKHLIAFKKGNSSRCIFGKI